MSPAARRFLVPGLLAGETRAEDLAPDVAAELLEELGPLVGQLARRAQQRNGSVPGPKAAAPDLALTAEEVAERLGVSVEWVYRHKAKLGGRRLSHRVVRFPESAVARCMAGKGS